jgi:hypothetical protein
VGVRVTTAIVLRAGFVGRAAIVAMAALPLAACAPRDPYVSSLNTNTTGNWRVERQVDRVTGAPISSAFLNTRAVSNSAIIFPRPAQMQLLCFKQQPAIRIVFNFKVGSNKNSEFGYRFDEKPGRQPEVRFVDDFKSVVIEDKAEVAQFVSEMVTSNVLYMRIRSLNAGRSSAEFHLDGAPAAIAAAFASCPVTQSATRMSKASMHRPAT